jgi:hypothetical protein
MAFSRRRFLPSISASLRQVIAAMQKEGSPCLLRVVIIVNGTEYILSGLYRHEALLDLFQEAPWRGVRRYRARRIGVPRMARKMTTNAVAPRIALRGSARHGRRAFSAVGVILAGLTFASSSVTGAWAQSNNAPPPSPAAEAIPVGIGILNAVAYQPIPNGSGFDTVVRNPGDLTGSTLDSAVLERVNQELTSRGYHVDHDAELVMLVGGDLVRGTSKDAVVDQIKGITPPQKQGNVFSTNGNTLLTQTLPDPSPNTFRISLSVYDRQTGTYVWRGSIDRGTSNLTPDQATDRMVPPLVATIGRTEKDRRIDIGTAQ